MLRLEAPGPADVDELLAFEVANRAYFEEHINARAPSYYSPEGVRLAIGAAVREAAADRAYQYLVRDGGGALIGRINLTQVRREHYHSAQLGYRIGREQTGKGIATQAVRLVLAKAFGEHGLVRVEATARAENLGSTRVLLRNGFVQFGHSVKSFELGGVWFDLGHFDIRTTGG